MLCHADVEVHGAPHTQHRAGSSSRTGCGPRHGGAAANTGADTPSEAYDLSDIAMERYDKIMTEVGGHAEGIGGPYDQPLCGRPAAEVEANSAVDENGRLAHLACLRTDRRTLGTCH